MISYPTAILLLSILFCTGASALTVALRRSIRDKERRLAEMGEALRSLQGASKAGEAAPTFDEDLRVASLTTLLQRPRLSAWQHRSDLSIPERYRYIHSLTEMGLDAREIASALSMSLDEITQILTLITVASRPRQQAIEPAPPAGPSATQPAVPSAAGHPPMVEKSSALGTNPGRPAPIRHSMKLSRWLKSRAIPALPGKKGSREPPAKPPPGNGGLCRIPLSGYT